jgi:hypothetical protein
MRSDVLELLPHQLRASPPAMICFTVIAQADGHAEPVPRSQQDVRPFICSCCCQAALSDEDLSHHRYRGAEGEIVCKNTNNQAQLFFARSVHRHRSVVPRHSIGSHSKAGERARL